MSSKQEITTRIIAAREKLGLSQSQAAKKWGLSKHTLQAWEQGSRNPAGLYLEKLEKILKAAGC